MFAFRAFCVRNRRRAAMVLLLAAAVSSCARSVRVDGSTRDRTIPADRLVPLPSLADWVSNAEFVFTSDTVIVVPPGSDDLARVGRYLSDLIGRAAGPQPLRIETNPDSASPSILLQIADVPEAGDESYELTVAPGRVTIRGRTPAGVFYGVQTLRQLLPAVVEYRAAIRSEKRPLAVPAGRIVDSPRFAWRGAMLDVARHFLPVEDVKRYIDLMALHKLNRLHLHLADDQGWRIEIASWPKLAAHGGSSEVGGGPGGFFTRQQYRDLVSYASARHITIVPEIDMPGHTNSALASYPELNCDGVAPALYTGTKVGFSTLCVDKDITYEFIDDVVGEIAAMTPGPYFHIGGDEVEKLTAAQYVRFIERVQQIVAAHSKQAIGWDEIAPASLAPGTIVQHWRPKTTPADAVAKGARVIVSIADRAYLDMKYHESTPIGLTWAGAIDVRRAYDWDPATVAGVPEPALLGVEAALWTETVANIRDAEFLAFPRLAALAEVGWTRADRRTWDGFRVRLGAQAPRWAALGVNFYRSAEVEWIESLIPHP